MKPIMFIAFLALCLVACPAPRPPDPQHHSTEKGEHYFLPEGATNVKDQGRCWCTFEFEGKRFLFYRWSDRAALTQLIEEPSKQPVLSVNDIKFRGIEHDKLYFDFKDETYAIAPFAIAKLAELKPKAFTRASNGALYLYEY